MNLEKLLVANKEKIKAFLDAIKFDYRHWDRSVLYTTCFALLQELQPNTLDVLEIAPSHVWEELGFKSYTEVDYPAFDICKDKLERQFDLIIADQVFEHLLFPYRAAKNVYAMLKPGGHFLVSTPFLIGYHPCPYDCTRWTETGMKYFLGESGFALENIKTGSWGNRACVIAYLNKGIKARRRGYRSIKNDPEFPVSVWALAKK
ncbi:class I SAM-dependent methyltransferase [Trichothermofontia sp.]